MYYLVCAKVKEKSELLNILVMKVKHTFFEDLHLPNKATVRTFLVALALLSIFCLLIPMRIDTRVDSHILYFSKRVFVGVILFSFFLRSEEFFIDINNKETLDKVTTVITWIIFIAVVIVIGIPLILLLAILSLVFKGFVYPIMVMLASSTLFIFGIKPKFVNSFPALDQCVLVANHCSTVDELFLPLIFWLRKWKVVFAFEVVRIPMVKFFAELFVGIPVDRKDSRSKIKAALQTQRAIKQGFNIMIFPEGRRLRTSEYEKGKLMEDFVDNGAFELSIKNNLPIVPAVISWTFLFKPRSGQWWYSPRTIKIIYLDPVYPDGKTVEEMKLQVHNLMLATLKQSLAN